MAKFIDLDYALITAASIAKFANMNPISEKTLNEMRLNWILIRTQVMMSFGYCI